LLVRVFGMIAFVMVGRIAHTLDLCIPPAPPSPTTRTRITDPPNTNGSFLGKCYHGYGRPRQTSAFKVLRTPEKRKDRRFLG
jgi:hypothetical protein